MMLLVLIIGKRRACRRSRRIMVAESRTELARVLIEGRPVCLGGRR